MRVLYEHRTQAGCAEGEHIRGVVAAFRALGHQVELVEPPSVRGEQAPSTGEPIAVISKIPLRRLLRLAASHLPEFGFEVCELLYNLWEIPRLLLRTTRTRPDLLYARYSLFTFAPAVVARIRKVPLVLEINDATFIKRSRPLAMRAVARRIEGWIFRQAAVCVTISRTFAQMACSNFHLSPDRVLVLPNAINPNRFLPDRPPAARNATVLGVVGAFVPWHGLDFLVDAVARLRVGNPGLAVLLVGDGPIRSEIETQVHRLGLDEIVRFTGFVPPTEVPHLLREMDICVIPDSNDHGSPMKLFEYMAMGKAILAPRYSPIEEVLENGVTGLLFAPRDLEDFCCQAERLLQDRSMREALGQNARGAVLERHTWVANVQNLLCTLQVSKFAEPN
jgi:glycosyltransferase involved in cell wall biosynthesis